MLGIGVYDFIIKDQYDPELGITYPALNCCNDPLMAERCKVPGAQRVIWSVKATQSFNNEICLLLRNGIQNGRINLLIDENECETTIKDNVKGYSKLTITDQIRLKMPFIQTSLLVNELINLDHEVKGTNIRIKERSGMRKDRYSSLAYNYWVVTQVERKSKPKETTEELLNQFMIKTTKRKRFFD